MDDQWKEDSPQRHWLWLLVGFLVVLVVSLAIPLAIYVLRSESAACQEGLQIQRECHNATQLLRKQLSQVQERFLGAETQADTCKQSVVKLQSQELKQQKKVQELEGAITRLNQTLQTTLAELEQLRKESTASGGITESSPASSQATRFLQVPAWLLLLGLSIRLL
ncbi:Bone marrow stromal antigen 2 [Sciurus carolinensis]|uniref:Bone marrow stromal antigen 2 n=1 Tax=Sciurus carolinensis TaxID=30640 RepID=A0AA41MIK0_SCICA|nr:Bone marrow stromal antigen 2 [Sciurus carolinensis]